MRNEMKILWLGSTVIHNVASKKLWQFAGIVVDFGKKKKHLKKAPFQGKLSTFLAKKALFEQKKALSKHYFINKKQQESTYN